MQDVQPEQLAVFLAAIFAANHENTMWGKGYQPSQNSNQIRPNPTFDLGAEK
jgi:hypothetical protein